MDTLVELLDESARRHGPNPALLIKPTFRYRVWTYEDLAEESRRVASYLQEAGVRKGDRVLLWGPNMPQWVVAFFGVLRAGAIAVPLDVRSAPDFVTRVVERTGPKLAFTSRFTSRSMSIGLPSVHLEALDQALESHSPHAAEVDIAPDDPAEIMFTSGTTGEPKGVILTHRNVASNVQAAAPAFPGGSSDRMLSLLPLSHMFEQTGGMLIPLVYGCRIVYPTSRQPSFIFKALQENRITVLLLVPQALQLFMDGIEREVERQGKERLWRVMHRIAPRLPAAARRRLFRRVHARMGGSTRYILSGGAYLDPDLAQKWENLGIPIVEGYGATEAAPVITFNRVGRRVSGSVGRALEGQDIRIAEDGEVLTRGPNVTPGYWQNEEATAAAFDGEWYRTGDLGYMDDAGYLYLKGRKKDLIVLANGQNVFPEDIERLLNAHPLVKEGVVVGLSDERSTGETVHAVLLLEDPTVPAREIVNEVNDELADHQRIVSHTVWHEEDLPRTHTLKVRKGVVLDYLKAAASQGSERASLGPGTMASAQVDPLVRIIAQIAEVPVQAVESSKTLGGDFSLDSLKRVELLSIVEQELGAYIDESLVGPNTTVEGLAELVTRQAQVSGHGLRFYQWPLTAWATALRRGIQHTIIFPLLATMYRPSVTGLENLEGLRGPVIFAIN
ncbi:MAG: AMP-binding protein, partial [Chloroflexi bacterium]|nr:AMP-binding protein [Chloroflexota bacterium]